MTYQLNGPPRAHIHDKLNRLEAQLKRLNAEGAPREELIHIDIQIARLKGQLADMDFHQTRNNS